MTQTRRPLLRVQHVWIRHRARRRDRARAAAEASARRRARELRGHVDEPVSGQWVDQPGFTVRGWCAWGDRPALAVAVCVDGVLVGHSAVGTVARRDVARAAASKNLSESGWEIQVSSDGWTSGSSVELSVLVWAEATRPPIVLDRFHVSVSGEEVDDTQYVGALSEPPADEPVDRVFPVRGWLMRGRHSVSRLEVLVDGERVGTVRLGLPGPAEDVRQGGLISGFDTWVDLSDLASDKDAVRLQLVAGSTHDVGVPVFERDVQFRPAEPVPERSAREAERAGRRERALAAMQVPRSPDRNLAVFTHQLDYGGGQLWLEEFLKESGAGSRFECTVTSFKDGPLRELAEERGITVHVTDGPPVDDFERYEDRITELAAWVASGGSNVVLVNTAPVFSGADVAARLNLPCLWAIHESFTPGVLMAVAFPTPIHPRVLAAARHAMAAADALVFEAAATRDLYAGWARPGHSVVVPYGVDTRAIQEYARRGSRAEAKANVGMKPGTRVLLVMGTIEPRKAQTRIAQAFARVAADHPGWSVAFVGDTNSRYSEVLKQYIGHLGLEDRCMVIPVDEDAYRWYHAADVLLSASDVESLPRSMLEAMCFGVTVVSASAFGVPELVTDGHTGFLFEPNDLDALEAALHRVLGLGDDERERVGEAGRDYVFEHHDSSGYAGDLLRLCEGLLRGEAANPHEILSTSHPQLGSLDVPTAR